VPAEVRELSIEQIRGNRCSFSPGHYSDVHVATPEVRLVRDLLDADEPYDGGAEPGSGAYVDRSTKHLIRTKALQRESWLVYPKGDAIVPINPLSWHDQRLAVDDILLSKDSNVGEVAVLDAAHATGHMRSGGVLRLNPNCNRWYLFAFLKHPSFVSQVKAATPRGATIRHAGERWLECKIPLPRQTNAEQVMEYVGDLARCIVEKERAIRARSEQTFSIVDDELRRRSTGPPTHTMPTLAAIKRHGRFDAAIYDRAYSDAIALVDAYEHGSESPSSAGFTVSPGPSLELKIIKTREDAEEWRPGLYTLLLPKNLSEYGTVNRWQWLGTAKSLPLLEHGDVVFGEAGFHKGRSVVLLEAPAKCTTNAHGIYARHDRRDLEAAIVFRAIFHWYRESGLIDLIAVGGSGGHLSPSYFDEYIRLPKFPATIRRRLTQCYAARARAPIPIGPRDLIRRHARRNSRLGTWHLEGERQALLAHLRDLQAGILRGERVGLPRARHAS
jgi:hypothetical protein